MTELNQHSCNAKHSCAKSAPANSNAKSAFSESDIKALQKMLGGIYGNAPLADIIDTE